MEQKLSCEQEKHRLHERDDEKRNRLTDHQLRARHGPDEQPGERASISLAEHAASHEVHDEEDEHHRVRGNEITVNDIGPRSCLDWWGSRYFADFLIACRAFGLHK